MRPRRGELEPHALEGVLAVVHERADRAQAPEQWRQLVLRAAENQRPPLLQLGGDQPARLGAPRNARPPLPLVERARLVVAPDLARKVDRVQVAAGVLAQCEQRERGREPVRDTGLDRDLGAEVAEDRVDVRALGVADRAERVSAPADGGQVLAALLEEMLVQTARPQLALVARKHVAAAEEVGDLRPDPARLGQAPRVSHGASRPVQRAFQAADRIVACLDVSDARILHLPVNLAGTGWAHVNALRRKDVDARLLVFWPQRWRPDEYDINLDLPRQGFLRQQLVQWRALARYPPQTAPSPFYCR